MYLWLALHPFSLRSFIFNVVLDSCLPSIVFVALNLITHWPGPSGIEKLFAMPFGMESKPEK
jgi:hypothetical protein